jgi:hypothetical protein
MLAIDYGAHTHVQKAKICVAPNQDLGEMLFYYLQELWNISQRQAILQLQDSARNKAVNQNDYVEGMEKIEYGALPFRYDLATVLDNCKKPGTGATFQAFNSNLARNMPFDAYMQHIRTNAASHVQAIKDEYNALSSRGCTLL